MDHDVDVGQRIAQAREYLGLTQAAVAQRMGLARTTQVAIEQGHRAVAVSELQRYAQILERPLSYFFGQGVWAEDSDFQVAFRQISERLSALHAGPPRRPGRPRGSTEAPPEKRNLMIFEDLCRHGADLQRLNRLPPMRLPDLPVPMQHSGQEAERLAAAVRAYLDVGGQAPLVDLRRFLEQAFGVYVFVMDDLGRLQAAGLHHAHAGACVLLAQAPPQVLRFELARAIGHLLANRERVLVRVAGTARRTAQALFAETFAGALLVPPRGLRECFAATGSGRGADERVVLAHLARRYGVSVALLRNRLRTQRLMPGNAERDPPQADSGPDTAAEHAPLPSEATDAPAAFPDPSGLGKSSLAALRGNSNGTRWAMLPERYVFLALRAYRNGHIDTARLAECLRTNEATALLYVRAYENDPDA